MRVTTTRHVDEDEPDEHGRLAYRYRFTIFRFSDGARSLVARSYDDTPEEAHFIGREAGDGRSWLERRDLDDALLRAAVRHLREREGKTRLQYLDRDNRATGYSEIAP